ncbi:hypothetical protein M5K25_005643 [Dendrobium thyrsiflorum]|uniref:Uncharacterized protein n=1 Tax=Dendrobium thyrsiflorum TaxID=117978 RepID=A0ABD0VJ61_DENTH
MGKGVGMWDEQRGADWERKEGDYSQRGNVLCDPVGIHGSPQQSPSRKSCGIQTILAPPTVWKWSPWESIFLAEEFLLLSENSDFQTRILRLEFELTALATGTPLIFAQKGKNNYAKIVEEEETFIWPLLIFERAPISSTGVFPVEFFSSNGPILGLFSPCFSASPRISRAHKRSKKSATLTGSHLNNNTESLKVETPSTSLGKM